MQLFTPFSLVLWRFVGSIIHCVGPLKHKFHVLIKNSFKNTYHPTHFSHLISVYSSVFFPSLHFISYIYNCILWGLLHQFNSPDSNNHKYLFFKDRINTPLFKNLCDLYKRGNLWPCIAWPWGSHLCPLKPYSASAWFHHNPQIINLIVYFFTCVVMNLS